MMSDVGQPAPSPAAPETEVGRDASLIRVDRVSKTFDPRDGALLTDISFEISAGETLAFTGKSGSGKSTLLSIAGGFLQPDQGAVTYDLPSIGARQSLNDRMRARFIGMVFQYSHLVPTLSAAENVEIPMIGQGIARHAREARARDLLHQVGLAQQADRKPAQLSGGERQRVGVARAFALAPKLILADEPTGSLDRAAADAITEVLLSITQRHNGALIVVTHDLALAHRMDRRMELRDGRLFEAELGATP